MVAPGDDVEPVDCPVERLADVRPAELADRHVVRLAQGEEVVPGLSIPLRRTHPLTLAPGAPPDHPYPPSDERRRRVEPGRRVRRARRRMPRARLRAAPQLSGAGGSGRRVTVTWVIAGQVAAAGEGDPGDVAALRRRRDADRIDGGRPGGAQQPGERGLLGGAVARQPAQMGAVGGTEPVRRNTFRRGVDVEAAIAGGLRQDEERPREPMPAEVRALPHPARLDLLQRDGDRPSPDRAARVPDAVGADEHERVGAFRRRVEAAREGRGRGIQVLPGPPLPRHLAARDGVDGVPGPGDEPGPVAPDEQDATAHGLAGLGDRVPDGADERGGGERLTAPRAGVFDEEPPTGGGGAPGHRLPTVTGRRRTERSVLGHPTDATSLGLSDRGHSDGRASPSATRAAASR